MVYSIGTGAVPTHSLTPAVEIHSSHHHSSPSVPDFSHHHHHHHRHHDHSTIDFGTSFQAYPSSYYQADSSTPKSTDREYSDSNCGGWCGVACCILVLLVVVALAALFGTGVITIPAPSDDYDYWW